MKSVFIRQEGDKKVQNIVDINKNKPEQPAVVNKIVKIEALNSFGLGRRFYKAYQDKVFYVEEKNSWCIWNGQRFIPSQVRLEHMAKEVLEKTIREESANITYGDTIKDTYGNDITQDELHYFIDTITDLGGISRMIAGARLVPEILASQSEFDAAPNLLNTQNGVVDLKTGELFPHDPKYKLTKITNTKYNPNAKSELFDSFLKNITKNRAELMEFLQIVIGYSLTGLTEEQVFFIFCGDGANGKSTLLNVISRIMGMYAQSTPAQTLLAAKGNLINADEARLHGSRFVVAVEVNDGQKFDEAKVKRLTGSDMVVARFLRQNYFEFRPEFKLFIAVNTLPKVTPNKAIFRRIKVIPFDATFDDKQIEKKMESKLLEESEAILAWAVEGAVKWYQNGFPTCKCVDDAISNYKETADVVKTFLSKEEGVITIDAKSRISVGELYKTYKDWADENCKECLAKNQFSTAIEAKGFERTRDGSCRYFKGLNLITRV
ncbi:MAG: hypothetical protein HQK67_13090 [Desulfamplus sp.]|nr:hypothetical protein [Desulfamplus sp.]